MDSIYGLGLHSEIHMLLHRVEITIVDVLKSTTSVTADRIGSHG